MAEKVPVYDNHIHMSPSGRNVDALREFEAAGGTGLTLFTLPHREVPITCGAASSVRPFPSLPMRKALPP